MLRWIILGKEFLETMFICKTKIPIRNIAYSFSFRAKSAHVQVIDLSVLYCM